MDIIYKVINACISGENQGRMFSSFPSAWAVEYLPNVVTTPPIEGSMLYAFSNQKYAEEYIKYIENCINPKERTLSLWKARGNIMATSAPGAFWERDFTTFWEENWYANDLYNYTKVTTGFNGAIWCSWIELISPIGG
jgi:hypothetical protein